MTLQDEIPGDCQFRSRLSNAFHQTQPVAPQFQEKSKEVVQLWNKQPVQRYQRFIYNPVICRLQSKEGKPRFDSDPFYSNISNTVEPQIELPASYVQSSVNQQFNPTGFQSNFPHSRPNFTAFQPGYEVSFQSSGLEPRSSLISNQFTSGSHPPQSNEGKFESKFVQDIFNSFPRRQNVSSQSMDWVPPNRPVNTNDYRRDMNHPLYIGEKTGYGNSVYQPNCPPSSNFVQQATPATGYYVFVPFERFERKNNSETFSYVSEDGRRTQWLSGASVNSCHGRANVLSGDWPRYDETTEYSRSMPTSNTSLLSCQESVDVSFENSFDNSTFGYKFEDLRRSHMPIKTTWQTPSSHAEEETISYVHNSNAWPDEKMVDFQETFTPDKSVGHLTPGSGNVEFSSHSTKENCNVDKTLKQEYRSSCRFENYTNFFVSSYNDPQPNQQFDMPEYASSQQIVLREEDFPTWSTPRLSSRPVWGAKNQHVDGIDFPATQPLQRTGTEHLATPRLSADSFTSVITEEDKFEGLSQNETSFSNQQQYTTKTQENVDRDLNDDDLENPITANDSSSTGQKHSFQPLSYSSTYSENIIRSTQISPATTVIPSPPSSDCLDLVKLPLTREERKRKILMAFGFKDFETSATQTCKLKKLDENKTVPSDGEKKSRPQQIQGTQNSTPDSLTVNSAVCRDKDRSLSPSVVKAATILTNSSLKRWKTMSDLNLLEKNAQHLEETSKSRRGKNSWKTTTSADQVEKVKSNDLSVPGYSEFSVHNVSSTHKTVAIQVQSKGTKPLRRPRSCIHRQSTASQTQPNATSDTMVIDENQESKTVRSFHRLKCETAPLKEGTIVEKEKGGQTCFVKRFTLLEEGIEEEVPLFGEVVEVQTKSSGILDSQESNHSSLIGCSERVHNTEEIPMVVHVVGDNTTSSSDLHCDEIINERYIKARQDSLPRKQTESKKNVTSQRRRIPSQEEEIKFVDESTIFLFCKTPTL